MEGITEPAEIDAPIQMSADDESVEHFAEAAMEEIVSRLTENRMQIAKREYGPDPDEAPKVGEVVAADNTEAFDIRARRLENPKVTLWLKDCPTWANGAWQTHIYPEGVNAVNGKVNLTIDVRPF